MTTKPIAVATNDSEQSRAAVAWAAHRAERAKLPLTILHVVDDRWMAEPNPWIEGLHKTVTGSCKALQPAPDRNSLSASMRSS